METPVRATFLSTLEDDQALEESNQAFWDALLDRVRADGFRKAPRAVLDVGSHRGGLLERLARLWGATTLFGVEPVAALRKRAELRLRGQADNVLMVSPAEWSRVPTAGVDLLLAFESLQFIENLSTFFDEVARVLGEHGCAYVVLGCHGENPLWSRWKTELEAMGHDVFTHQPLTLMELGAARGFLPSVRPLRSDGWITHDPRDRRFGFSSTSELLDHHYRHKLLFRFRR